MESFEDRLRSRTKSKILILWTKATSVPYPNTDRYGAGRVAVIMDRGNHVPVHYVDTGDLVQKVKILY